MVASVRDKSATYDEPGHALGGYTYWKFNDYRINPENGNLPQRWFGLAYLGGAYRLPGPDDPAWEKADGRELADEWFHRVGNDPIEMLWRGRLLAAFTAVALAALVWFCSRRVFGAGGAMLSLLACVLNPTVLANGPLMTADVTAALFFLAAAWGWWQVVGACTPWRLGFSLFATAGLFLSKMSAPLIIPCVFILSLWRILDGSPLRLRSRNAVHGRGRIVAVVCGLALAHAVVAYVAVWGAYGFRYSLSAAPHAATSRAIWAELVRPRPVVDALDELELSPATRQAARRVVDRYALSGVQSNDPGRNALRELRDSVLSEAAYAELDRQLALPPSSAWPARVIGILGDHEVLPEAYLAGYLRVWRYSRTRPGFFWGEFSNFGSVWFFPFTFAVKTPIPTFGLLFLALTAIGRHIVDRAMPGRRYLSGLAPFIVLFAVYWLAALNTRLNIGHRHLLPVYPPLFVFCGAAAAWFDVAFYTVRTRGRTMLMWLAGLFVIAQAVEVGLRFPNFLAYFNGLIRPGRAFRAVVDSSLDWGQELPSTKRYVDLHSHRGQFYLSYFGTGDPGAYGIRVRLLPSDPGLFSGRTNPILALPSTAGPSDDYVKLDLKSEDDATKELFLLRPELLRLTPGTYIISATMLQWQWDEASEAAYQNLRRSAGMFLAADHASQRANIEKAGAARWNDALVSYQRARFFRLTGYLRNRQPDDEIGSAMLIYHLSSVDLDRALEGPPPFAERH